MISAFSKAIGQLSDPRIRKVLWIGIGASAAVFIALWVVLVFLLANTALFEIGWLETVVDWLGGAAALVLTWFLFPAVASLVIGLLLEEVAAAVEGRHYPGLPPSRQQAVSEGVFITVRFAVVTVLLNIPVLLFLVVPPLFPFVFYGVNGYLLGREYFELVAHRRADPIAARAMRKKLSRRLFPVGVLIAFMMTLPVVNLLTPVVAAAAMVHLFEAWRSKGALPQPA